MNKNIVIVDEARHELRPILTELKFQGVEVRYYKNADECVDNLLSDNDVCLFILDIMLISESVFPDDITDQQLYTGLILGRVIRETYPDVPIVFHSSINFEPGLRYTNNTVNAICNSRLIRKQDVKSPNDFWKMIGPILETGIAKKEKNRIFSALFSGAFLRPNIFGIGFNVKAFVNKLRDKAT